MAVAPTYRFVDVRLLSRLLAAALLLAPFPGFAEPSPFSDSRVSFTPEVSGKEPVLLEAEKVHYDQEQNLVIAEGKVAVTQGDMVLLADRLIYQQPTDMMYAEGHVSMLESSGNVYFADRVELRQDMKAGVINQFRARLSDNSLFAAAKAERVNENVIEMDKAVYSPCKVCARDSWFSEPQWQIHADHIKVDQEKQKVYYDDTTFELYGVPIFYTPYFSHPTPDADNQSGVLTPEYAHDDNLGSIYKLPVYYSIAPDKDVTLTPILTTDEGLVMAGEYRQQFDAGGMTIDGSITQPKDRDASGNPSSGKQLRGHVNAIGKFDIDRHHDWGFDIHRATDDTYLRRYNFSNDVLLTSRLYGEAYNFEGTNDRSYAVAQGLYFQGLTAQDNADTIPMVLPLVDLIMESDPGWMNSRFSLGSNLMVLTRDIGDESRRFSANVGWKLPYITDDGQVIEFETSVRGDLYSVEDVPLSGGGQFDGTTGRFVPQASLTWRYPLINHWQGGSLLLEPVVNFTVSPGGGNPEKIPNEDSLVPEFTDTNLFSPNRFAGYDRVENGPRMSYGLRGQAQLWTTSYIDWLFGQHYRIDNDRNFPFSNDLVSHFSDYVGKVGFNVDPFSVAYRFRLDKDGLAAKRNEIDGTFNYYPINLGASYLSLKNDPILANKEQVAASASLNLTHEWAWTATVNRDLLLDQLVSAGTGLTYQNECTNLTGILGKEYTRDRDIKPSTTFLVRVSLKNLE